MALKNTYKATVGVIGTGNFGTALANLLADKCKRVLLYARNEQIFKPLIYDVLEKEVIPEALEVCKIVPAKLGDSIGDYAALCVAMQ